MFRANFCFTMLQLVICTSSTGLVYIAMTVMVK
jgi:hypothetical protein